jgi:hypothetical protein
VTGVEKALTFMHHHYTWPGIKEDITQYVRCCDACQQRKLVIPEVSELRQPAVYGPFRHVHVDLAGPFILSSPCVPAKGKKAVVSDPKVWVLLMVDYFTKVAEFEIITTKEATSTAKVFYDSWICRYGVPAYVTTDNGTEFRAEFHHMLLRVGTTQLYTSVAHPQANGAVERLVKSFKAIMASHVNDCPVGWAEALSEVRKAYMWRVHKATGFSPVEMLMGFKPELPLPVNVNVVVGAEEQQYIQDLSERLGLLDNMAFGAIRSQFENNARQYKIAQNKKKNTTCPPWRRLGTMYLRLTTQKELYLLGLKAHIVSWALNLTVMLPCWNRAGLITKTYNTSNGTSRS